MLQTFSGRGELDINELKKKLVEELCPETVIKIEIEDENTSDALQDSLNILNDNYSVQDDHSDEEKKIIERRGLGPILRQNSLKLIKNSTMFPFQYNKCRYICLICKEHFIEMSSLQNHTNEEHKIEEIEKLIINQQNKLLKTEISFLYCRICNAKQLTIADLRQHLIDQHKFKFYTNYDLLVPYKIQTDGLVCQICSETFEGFRLLNIHVNKHFQNHVCDVCGTSFSNLVFLNLHKSRTHKILACKLCDVTFDKRTDKTQHDANIHNVIISRKPRFPCPECDERFHQENLKIQHLVDKHGMKKPVNKCPMCDKDFITKSLLTNHTKYVHMKEKKHECDMCHKFFYTNSDVKRHMVTHTGEKNFDCTLCNTSFSTKDTLSRHIKRIHLTN